MTHPKLTTVWNTQTLINSMKDTEKYQRALDLFIESVYKPDDKLRSCAYNQQCFDELMSIREHVIDYIHTLKSKHNSHNTLSSDKLENERPLSKWR